MDQEQKEEIYREYSADNMKKLRKLIGYQTTRFGKGCGYKWVDKDYDEFLSMANMQLWKILESFNEEENDSFDDYLKTMLVRKMKQTCTWCNRDKRQQYARDENGNKIVEEDFAEFVDRTTKVCETVNGKILNVSYPNEDIAVIVIRYKNGE